MKHCNKFDYKNGELHFSQWNSWYCQVKTIMDLNPKRVLEIGVGDGTVRDYLIKKGIEVKTLDFDEKLCPDFIGDIRNTTLGEKFDVVNACEVLEHIPYEDFEETLINIKRMTNKNVLISLPEPQIYSLLFWKFRGMKRLLGIGSISFSLKFNKMFFKNKFDGQHFWNVGQRGTSLRRIKKDISRYFKINKIFRNPINPTHIFFLLEVKDE